MSLSLSSRRIWACLALMGLVGAGVYAFILALPAPTARNVFNPALGVFADYRAKRLEIQSQAVAMAKLNAELCSPTSEHCTAVAPAFGQVALRGAAPYQAQIMAPGDYAWSPEYRRGKTLWELQHYCGGTLIARGWVLTAAHCVDENMIAEGFGIRIGMSNLSLDDGRSFTMDQVILHPQFKPAEGNAAAYKHDIALVHFDAPEGAVAITPYGPEDYEQIGVVAAKLDTRAGLLRTWSEDMTARVWDENTGAELLRREMTSTYLLGDAAYLDPLALDKTNLPAEPYRYITAARPPLPLVPGVHHLGSHADTGLQIFPFGERDGSRLIQARGDDGARALNWSVLQDGQTGGIQFSLGVEDVARGRTITLITDKIPEQMRVDAASNSLVILTRQISFDDLDPDAPLPAEAFIYDIEVLDLTTLARRWAASVPAWGEDVENGGPGLVHAADVSGDKVALVTGTRVILPSLSTGDANIMLDHPQPEWAAAQGQYPAGKLVLFNNVVELAKLLEGEAKALTLTRRWGASDAWIWDLTGGDAAPMRLPQTGLRLGEHVIDGQVFAEGTRLLLWTQFGTFIMWDLESGSEIGRFDNGLSLLNAAIIEGGGAPTLWVQDAAGSATWDLETGARIVQMDHLDDVSGGNIVSVRDGAARALTWSNDGTARLWDIMTGREVRRVYHTGKVYGAQVLEGAARLLSWSDDGTARITQIETGETLLAVDHLAAADIARLAPPVDPDAPPGPALVQYLDLAAPQNDVSPDYSVEIYGWGKTRAVNGNEPFAALMTVNLRPLSNPDCAALPGYEMGKQVHPGVFCAGDSFQKTCRGDSGGPVVQGGVLVGVVSWGKKDCLGDGKPGVYTRVSAYRGWISQVLAGNGDALYFDIY